MQRSRSKASRGASRSWHEPLVSLTEQAAVSGPHHNTRGRSYAAHPNATHRNGTPPCHAPRSCGLATERAGPSCPAGFPRRQTRQTDSDTSKLRGPPGPGKRKNALTHAPNWAALAMPAPPRRLGDQRMANLVTQLTSLLIIRASCRQERLTNVGRDFGKAHHRRAPELQGLPPVATNDKTIARNY